MTVHGEFNNLLTENRLPTKKSLDKLHSLYDFDFFKLNTRQSINIDSCNFIRSNYSPNSFKKMIDKNSIAKSFDSFSILYKYYKFEKELTKS